MHAQANVLPASPSGCWENSCDPSAVFAYTFRVLRKLRVVDCCFPNSLAYCVKFGRGCLALRFVCAHFSFSVWLHIFPHGYVVPKSPSGCWENSRNPCECRSVHAAAVGTALSLVPSRRRIPFAITLLSTIYSCIQLSSHG